MNEIVPFSTPRFPLPAIIETAGAGEHFLEFFAATIRNRNTRSAYLNACNRFCFWCDTNRITLLGLRPLHVAAYVELLCGDLSKPSVKLHLAAIRQLLNFLATRGVIAHNPAISVRGPKHVVVKGKTPVLMGDEVRTLFQSIDDALASETDLQRRVMHLRDRALIAVMGYSFARISAVLAMNVEDFMHLGRRSTFRFHEKGGKDHDVPASRIAAEYLDAYIQAAGIGESKDGALFRTMRGKRLTETRMQPREALAMIKRRGVAAGLGNNICNHTMRASGITNFRLNGGTLEKAQAIAAHASPRTTAIYDRTSDAITIDEIERVRF